MIPITVREEMVAPVIMSTSFSAPVAAPCFTPTIGVSTSWNPVTKSMSLKILSPRPGVSLLSRTFIPSKRPVAGS